MKNLSRMNSTRPGSLGLQAKNAEKLAETPTQKNPTIEHQAPVDVAQAQNYQEQAGRQLQSYSAAQSSAQSFSVVSTPTQKEITGSISIRFPGAMNDALETGARVAELNVLKDSEGVGTVTLNSGLQVAGVLVDVKLNDAREPIFLRFAGPTQLAKDGQQLAGQGGDYHSSGYSSPVGALRDGQCLSEMNAADLAKIGIVEGEDVTGLEFASGIKVSGKVKSIGPDSDSPMFIAFSECTVTLGEQKLFQPSWGTFDMAVGESVKQTANGAADVDAFSAFAD